MVPSEAKKIDRYIWGLTPQIRGMVTSAEPTTLEKAILLAASLTDEMVRTGTLTKKQARGKRKRMEFQGKKTNNDARKDHGTTKNFVMATTERKPYNGPLPKCNKCNYHHHGNCNKIAKNGSRKNRRCILQQRRSRPVLPAFPRQLASQELAISP
ncbi:hypothetical protein E3N88_32847 [Mikania micrantha]|uniref:Reverse transcriptase domain-containing protein n=1 Tax=Mikania micrantha TaxID=192012 RepID=A0A5N6MA39_9ASTR|nr:hypothetical protein E3N88_32847 [Mikania micrantha]